MDNLKDIRWRQRYENFKKALAFLLTVRARDTENDEVARAALLQAFEFTFELAWKTLKDKLEAEDIAVDFPREVIMKAFETNCIRDGKTWIEMLKTRNELSHLYDEVKSKGTAKKIGTEYAPMLNELNEYLEKSL